MAFYITHGCNICNGISVTSFRTYNIVCMCVCVCVGGGGGGDHIHKAYEDVLLVRVFFDLPLQFKVYILGSSSGQSPRHCEFPEKFAKKFHRLQGAQYSKIGCPKPKFFWNLTPKQDQDFHVSVAAGPS